MEWKFEYALLFADIDDDNYWPSKRARADFRPPLGMRNNNDTDGMQSSPGRSQQDVPTTDHTDDEPYPYEVYNFLV